MNLNSRDVIGKKLLNISLNKKFIQIDKSLTNFTKYSISSSLSPEMKDSVIDFEEEYSNVLLSEISNSIYKYIYVTLSSTKNIDFIDLRGYQGGSIGGINSSNFICHSLSTYNFKNLITSGGNIVSLEDSPVFKYDTMDKLSLTTNVVNKIGSFLGLDAYMYHYLKYNDTWFLLFDDVKINYQLKELRVIESHTFTPKIVVDYLFDISVGESIVVYPIYSEQDESYRKYLSISREIKINDILQWSTIIKIDHTLLLESWK